MNTFSMISILALSIIPSIAIDCYNSCDDGCTSTSSTFGCSCNNGNDAAILFSVSLNGVSVNRVGKQNYVNFITKAADIVSQSSGQFGLYTFGNIGTSISSLTNTDYTSIDAMISNLSTIDIDSEYGNIVSTSNQNAIEEFSSITGRQKYHIIFSAGFPLSNFGTSTKLINVNNPCNDASEAKQANIQTFVVLYGEDGKDFVKGSYSCLVENIDTDIIIVDPSDPDTSLASISDSLCKTDGIDVKITEVNPLGQTGGYKAFIEGINRGLETSIRACFSNGCSSYMTVPTGEYFVAYDATSNGNTPTATHSVADLSAGSGNTGWVATLEVNGYSSPVDTVTYGSYGSSQVSDWQIVNPLKTYELRGVGYNSQYGGNWRQSCNSGSPGIVPASECNSTLNSCLSSNINCTINGALVGSNKCAIPDYDSCNCATTGAYMSDVDSCIKMPLPTNCRGYIINDPTHSDKYLVLQWNKAEWDGDIGYAAEYLSSSGSIGTISNGGMASMVIRDYRTYSTENAADYANIIAKYDAPLTSRTYSATANISCPVVTSSPTESPTVEPTANPLNDPSQSPTPSPVYDEPGVFIDKICPFSRCECFEEDRSCCILFSDNEPYEGCQQHVKYIEIFESEDYQKDIKFTLYPDGYEAETIVYYQLSAYGQVNKTDIANVTFFNELSKRRRMAANDTMTTTSIPAPSTEYENRLNIEVAPIYTSSDYYGNTTIVDGDEFATLTLTMNTASLKCVDGDINCITSQECLDSVLLFELTTIRCDVESTKCLAMYPSNLWIAIYRSSALCGVTICNGDNCDISSNELPGWIWWLLIALVVFMIIMAWLIYRFWWRQKRAAKEISDVEDDLIKTVHEIEQGIGQNLDVGDVMWNEFATGIPNVTSSIDPAGNELFEREKQQQNEFVHVDAEVWQVRQDLAPQITDNSIHQQTQRNIVGVKDEANDNYAYTQYPHPTPTKDQRN